MKKNCTMRFALAILLLTGLLAGIHPAVAQLTDPVSGRVIRRDSLSPVTDVNIVNKSRAQGTTSDAEGFFTIPAQSGDTVVFSAVGYTKLKVAVTDSVLASPVIVALIPKTYELSEVAIRQFKSEEEFKKEFLELELPDKPNLELPKIEGVKLAESVYTLPTGGIALTGPFSALYNKFSKKAKEQKKLQSLQRQQGSRQQYEAKFNRDLVARVTGLKDQELEAFMTYCKLSESFVMESNDYDIVLAINDCYKSFKAGKEKHQN